MTFLKVRDQAYRKRREKRPLNPKTVDDVNISSYSDLVMTANGKPFYRGRTKTCSEVFMSDTQVEIAAASDTLFIDGTFSICPSPFFQVVFCSAKVGENVFPIATALLPNKLEATYRDVLELIRDVCEENGKSLDFIYCHSDCEQGILNAVRVSF